MKVAVISGGFSQEQNSSRESGMCVAQALESFGHTVSVIEYDRNLISNIEKESPDVIFPFVQGKHHGDGAVQAMLELTGIPYVGSRPYAAAVINHKTVCKKIWRAAGILTPDFFEYSYEQYVKDGFEGFICRAEAAGLSLPAVAKPPAQGSRFGMVFVRDKCSFKDLTDSFRYDDPLLIESYVPGRFFTQGIVEIGGKMTVLPPVEVVDGTKDEFKRYPGGSATRAHDLMPEQLSDINNTTLAAAELTCASGFARLDYHLSGGKLYLLEINAFPGLVPGYSSMNDCVRAAGYGFAEFIGMLLATAGCAREGGLQA